MNKEEAIIKSELLWEEYIKVVKKKKSPYSIGTFGIWCYEKGKKDKLNAMESK